MTDVKNYKYGTFEAYIKEFYPFIDIENFDDLDENFQYFLKEEYYISVGHGYGREWGINNEIK